MKTKKFGYSRLLLVMISFVLLIAACSTRSPASTLPIEQSPIPPSATSAQPANMLPPPVSTSAPTATPAPTATAEPTATIMPGVLSYLPTVADLPSGFEWSLSMETIGVIDSPMMLAVDSARYYSGEGWLYVEVRINKKPWKIGAGGLQLGSTGTLVDSTQVGDFSEAYLVSEDPPSSEFNFIKGNIRVAFRGPISVDAAVKVAQILEKRIPDSLAEVPPLTFPEELDPTAAAKFGNWALGKCTPDNTVAVPQTIFSSKENIGNCLQMDWIAPEPYGSHVLQYAIYDVQSQQYLVKYSSAHSIGQVILPGMAGSYEMRVALDAHLIAVLPFTVQ